MSLATKLCWTGALGVLAACSSPPPTNVTVVQPAQPPVTVATVAPQVPATVIASPEAPPPQTELVPPPPDATAAWQPGHWRWTGEVGRSWQWIPGHYLERPMGRTAWVIGQWQSTPSGWVWVEGHWR
jgi:hypothetical protein